jgi:hypothetical protein
MDSLKAPEGAFIICFNQIKIISGLLSYKALIYFLNSFGNLLCPAEYDVLVYAGQRTSIQE